MSYYLAVYITFCFLVFSQSLPINNEDKQDLDKRANSVFSDVQPFKTITSDGKRSVQLKAEIRRSDNQSKLIEKNSSPENQKNVKLSYKNPIKQNIPNRKDKNSKITNLISETKGKVNKSRDTRDDKVASKPKAKKKKTKYITKEKTITLNFHKEGQENNPDEEKQDDMSPTKENEETSKAISPSAKTNLKEKEKPKKAQKPKKVSVKIPPKKKPIKPKPPKSIQIPKNKDSKNVKKNNTKSQDTNVHVNMDISKEEKEEFIQEHEDTYEHSEDYINQKEDDQEGIHKENDVKFILKPSVKPTLPEHCKARLVIYKSSPRPIVHQTEPTIDDSESLELTLQGQIISSAPNDKFKIIQLNDKEKEVKKTIAANSNTKLYKPKKLPH